MYIVRMVDNTGQTLVWPDAFATINDAKDAIAEHIVDGGEDIASDTPGAEPVDSDLEGLAVLSVTSSENNAYFVHKIR